MEFKQEKYLFFVSKSIFTRKPVVDLTAHYREIWNSKNEKYEFPMYLINNS